MPFLAQTAPAPAVSTSAPAPTVTTVTTTTQPAPAPADEPRFSSTHEALLSLLWIIGGAFIVSLVLKRVFLVLGKKLTHSNYLVATGFRSISRSTHFLIFTLTLRACLSVPGFHLGVAHPGALRAAGVLVILAFTAAIFHLVSVPVAWFDRFASKTESKLDDMLVPVVDTALRVMVLLSGVIQIIVFLSGSTPAQIVTALGVGGLAVGLAAQDTIKNFFGSLMLIVDKPFTLGDYVNIGSHQGNVESLGLRSTRIRTPDGHLVSVPNGDLANRAIQNVTLRKNLRQLFTIGLTYDTKPAKLEEALKIVRGLLENHEGFDPALPPRVHFEKMADWSLNIQVIYWYHPADYWKFMDFNQRLQLEILRRFEAAGINIAFPTQTVIQQSVSVPAPAISPPDPAPTK